MRTMKVLCMLGALIVHVAKGDQSMLRSQVGSSQNIIKREIHEKLEQANKISDQVLIAENDEYEYEDNYFSSRQWVPSS